MLHLMHLTLFLDLPPSYLHFEANLLFVKGRKCRISGGSFSEYLSDEYTFDEESMDVVLHLLQYCFYSLSVLNP